MFKFLLSKKMLLLACSFDIGTSVGGQELNPVLGRGTFGVRQASIAGGITIGTLLFQHHLEIKHPEVKNTVGKSDGILTGIHIGLGVSNLYQQSK